MLNDAQVERDYLELDVVMKASSDTFHTKARPWKSGRCTVDGSGARRRQNVSAAAPICSERVKNSQMAENDNGVTFALEDEDHTLANALRFFLNKK